MLRGRPIWPGRCPETDSCQQRESFIFIIDEWDCVFRLAKERKDAQKEYLDFLRGLLKGAEYVLGGMRCKIDAAAFQNDMTSFRTRDDVLTLLIHLGYLAYDENTEEVFIPNQEIAQEYLRAMKTGDWGSLAEALKRSEELLRNTWALDGESVAEGISAIHNETAALLKYNNENSLTCTVLIAYYSAKTWYLNPVMELPSGKGYADVVYLPRRDTDRPALVVELKWNKSARGAIAQIKDRQYAAWIADYTGDILLVGIGYDRKSKEHSCVIETWKKV